MEKRQHSSLPSLTTGPHHRQRSSPCCPERGKNRDASHHVNLLRGVMLEHRDLTRVD